MDPLLAARKAKHHMFVAKKQTGFAFDRLRIRLEDYVWDKQERSYPYRYNASRYPHTFLARSPLECSNDRGVERIIYSVWLGAPMNVRRQESLDLLRTRNPATQSIWSLMRA